MATEHQIQANRANAKRSKGPVTPGGKTASSKNAIRHGLLAKSVLLKGESDEGFSELLASLIEEFQPTTANENALVETMAVSRWRILRNWSLQTATLEIETELQDSETGSSTVIAALAFRSLADNSHALHLLQRYETALDRQYSRALNTLLKVRAHKGQSKQEPLPSPNDTPEGPHPAPAALEPAPITTLKLRNDPNLRESVPIRKPVASRAITAIRTICSGLFSTPWPFTRPGLRTRVC